MGEISEDKHFDGSGFPAEGFAGEEIPLGARVLKVLSDLLGFEEHGISQAIALRTMQKRRGWYDPELFSVVQTHLCSSQLQAESTSSTSAQLEAVKRMEAIRRIEAVKRMEMAGTTPPITSNPAKTEEVGYATVVHDLRAGDTLLTDVYTTDGKLLLPRGNVITELNLERIRNYDQLQGIAQPIRVTLRPAA